MPASPLRTTETLAYTEESKVRIAAAIDEMQATLTVTRATIAQTRESLREAERLLARLW